MVEKNHSTQWRRRLDAAVKIGAVFGLQGEADRHMVAVGAVDGGEELHGLSAVFERDERAALFGDSLQEVVDLLEVIVVHEVVERLKGGLVLCDVLVELVLFTGNGPQIEHRGLRDLAHAGNEHAAAVGLHADGCAVGAVDMDLAVESGILGVADDDRAERAALEAHDGNRGVLHLQLRMVQRGVVAVELFDIAHVPQEEVNLVRGLVDQHAAAFALPGAAPGIGVIVVHVAPAVHGDGAENGLADLAFVDGGADALARQIEPALADSAAKDARLMDGLDHGVAILQTRRDRLFHQNVHAAAGSFDGNGAMLRMRGADGDNLAAVGGHLFNRMVSLYAVLGGEGRGFFKIPAVDADKITVGACCVAGGVEMADLAAADDAGFDFTIHDVLLVCDQAL